MIELPAAMIGDVNKIDAVFDTELGVLRCGYTFDREWDLVFRLDAINGLPVERGLILAA